MGFFLYNVLDGFVADRAARRATRPSPRVATRRAKRCAARSKSAGGAIITRSTSPTTASRSTMPNAMTTGWAAYSGAARSSARSSAIEGGLSGDRAARPRAADREAVLRAFPALSRPHRRLSPGRARERRPIQPRRVLDRRRFRASFATKRATAGDVARSRALGARAFEIFEKISPLKKTDPDKIAIYGLIPIQQPADIYDGYGHGGRGGWSWYTGSAARMLSAAYALLGLR